MIALFPFIASILALLVFVPTQLLFFLNDSAEKLKQLPIERSD
jgi:hypothetical protein